MKNLFYLLLITLLLGCLREPDPENPETEYEAVLISRDELKNSIKLADARAVKRAGKIYRYGHLLFLNDKYEGVHVYDNSDPTNPEALAFIVIPGNLDIAIKNGVIYADNSVDLVALRYHENSVEILSRNENVFPELTPPDMGAIPADYTEENRPENTVIVKWIEK